MPYEDALQHEATPIITVTAGNWIDGDPDETTGPATPFACVLFLPLGGEDVQPRGRRTISRPTLLLSYLDLLGDVVDVQSADQLDVLAPDLPPPFGGPDPVRWQVEGFAQPFGPPGDATIGSQAILKRVED